ncbi:MAG: single-stranded DNA-binding protein [Psychroflexus sp.]|jgi:single-strand DNA-binding protein|nr:single-stranded DNA-binding protein [Psychroflexus sp.]MDR9448070.1 single-stranded DNA-binding protein [Psychroflexus sp.]
MSSLRNQVQLIGNLGKDPEVRELDSGRKVANFTLATNETYRTKDGEKKEDTQWHNIVAWGKTADIIEKFVTKGREVILKGKLTSRSYENKDGDKRYITEVVCDEVVLVGGK